MERGNERLLDVVQTVRRSRNPTVDASFRSSRIDPLSDCIEFESGGYDNLYLYSQTVVRPGTGIFVSMWRLSTPVFETGRCSRRRDDEPRLEPPPSVRRSVSRSTRHCEVAESPACVAIRGPGDGTERDVRSSDYPGYAHLEFGVAPRTPRPTHRRRGWVARWNRTRNRCQRSAEPVGRDRTGRTPSVLSLERRECNRAGVGVWRWVSLGRRVCPRSSSGTPNSPLRLFRPYPKCIC